MESQLSPWLENQWQMLWHAKQQNRLPHALLLIGPNGIGKQHFAERFAHYLLCAHHNACGECHACHLCKAKSHPDLILIEPEEPGQMIKIDQIRSLVELATTTPMQGGFRVIIINPAQAMNIAAANALLKTLEEPAPNTLLMLISDQSIRLPKTIISRCQRIIFHKPTVIAEDIAPFRQEFYQGLIALTQGQADPLQLAAAWQEQDLKLIFQLLLTWLQDCLRVMVIGKQTEWINTDYAAELQSLRCTRDKLLAYIDLVRERYAKIIYLQNLNRQLLLEELFIQWTYCHVSR